ncbi:MAG TPA: protein kinase [Myxococcales bacterium LLY-WYZ-16_1]|nr:protein kinase [Myxococcales bacterium LLY-WYZ-16_1]
MDSIADRLHRVRAGPGLLYAAGDVQPGSVLDERFRIARFVASGGMGAVYQAQDLRSGRPVAIKRFAAARAFFSDRFARESQVLQELRHPGIVSFVSQGLAPDGGPYIAMEWVEGRTLREVLRARRLTIEEAMVLCRRVAEALDETHRRGLLHLDLKPGNLMLLGQDPLQVKVLDFGLATLAHETGQGDKVQGTPGYMSPEQARKESLDGATDVFGLGCVLYEALTQVPAFDGPDNSAILTKIVAAEPEPLSRFRPRTPPRLADLVSQMLAKKPGDRPSLDQILAALDRVDPAPIQAEEPRSEGITLEEQRITAVLVARDPGGHQARTRLHFSNLAQLGFHIQILLDGTIVGVLETWANPLEAAVAAVRAGMRVASLLPDARITVGLGQVRRGATAPEGRALDDAFRRLDETPAGAISVDESVALLSSERFEIGSRGSLWVLEGDRTPIEEPRPLLGRVTPLLGRDKEIMALKEGFLESLRERRARFQLIVGEPGSGKSRLLRHGLGEPQRRGAIMLRARGEQERFQTMGVWKRLLRNGLELAAQSPSERIQERLATLPASARRPLWTLLQDGRSEADDPSARAAEVRTALGTWLEGLTDEQPVAVFIDDMQHLDAASRDTLRGLLQRLAERPLWVVGAVSPDGLLPLSTLDPQVLRLGPISDTASEELVNLALGPTCDAPSRRRIVEQAQGNPFLLEELVRAAARGESDEVPTSVLGLVQARLTNADASTRRVLRAASVFGRTFEAEGVRAVLDEPLEAVTPHLQAAVEAEFIRARTSDEAPSAVFSFRHQLLREAAYRSLPAEERRSGHERAAVWLETERDPAPERMARHWEQAGQPARAVPYYRRAAEAALEANDLDGALQLAGRGLARGAKGRDMGALELVQAEVRSLRGDLGSAVQGAQSASQLLEPLEPGWYRALSVKASCGGTLGFPSFVREVQHALDKHPGPTTWRRVATFVEVGVAFLRMGNAAEATPVLASLARLETELGTSDPRAEAWFESGRAAWATAEGDVSKALEHRNAAARAFRRAGDVRRACLALGEAGYARLTVGDMAGARQLIETAHGEARQVGLPHTEALLCCLWGAVLGRVGDWDQALDILQRAARSCSALQDSRGEGMARTYLASTLRRLGRTREGLDEIRKALTLLQEFPPDLAYASALLARLQLDLGEVEAAASAILEAQSYLPGCDPMWVGEMLVRLVHAQVLQAQGDSEGAHEALSEARRKLLQRAQSLRDPALRTGFLLKVPEHAKILSMARKELRGRGDKAAEEAGRTTDA